MADAVNLNGQNGASSGHHHENSHGQTQIDLQRSVPLAEEGVKSTRGSIDRLEQSEQNIQEIKFLLKLAHELQATGECPLPLIEDLVSTVYELREVMPKVLLPVPVVKQLNEQLKASCDRVFDYSDDLAQYIDLLIIHLDHKPQIDQKVFMETLNHIKRILPDLSHSISQILNIAGRVDQLLVSQNLSGLDLSNDFFEASKLIGDLRYFQAYLRQQSSAKLFNLQHYQAPYSELHYRRLQSYVFVLPIVCKNLVNLTRQRLEITIPGFPINS